MAILVANGAQIACSMGAAPSLLTVVPGPPHLAAVPVPPPPTVLATVSDFVPGTNIKTFGMCNSPLNPAVQTATTAADGVPTPAPCVPAVASPWKPPVPVTLSGVPAFDQKATCQCAWAGVITVVNPGQALIATVP